MPTCPAVILEHTEPEGGTHFDWLLAQDDLPHAPDDRVLVHFRCQVAPGAAEVGQSIEVELGPRHRWVYLRFEGGLSGDRGAVRQIASGCCNWQRFSAANAVFELEIQGHTTKWEGQSAWGNIWMLRRLA